MLEEADERILAYMQQARTGHYTTAQLARTTGIPVAEMQRRLAQLERDGYLMHSPLTIYPAFQLTEQGRAMPIASSKRRDPQVARHPLARHQDY